MKFGSEHKYASCDRASADHAISGLARGGDCPTPEADRASAAKDRRRHLQ